jgi:endonuclease YncB( thermonuclease family)
VVRKILSLKKYKNDILKRKASSLFKGILTASITGIFLGAFYLFVDEIDFSEISNEEELTGSVTHVRDADTIEVSGVPIRLNGISAPELNTREGQNGKTFLKQLVLNEKVVCRLNGDRTHDRKVGVCHLAGKDIGVSIVKAGHAADCPRYSNGRYKSFETVEARRWPLPNYCKAS